MLDMKALAEATAAIVREHVDKAIAPLVEENQALRVRMDALEAKTIPVDEQANVMAPLIEELLATRLAALPAPDMVAIGALVADEIAVRFANIPAPKDGASVTVEDVLPVVTEVVAVAMKEVPAPKDGIGMAGLFINRDGEGVATMSDGTIHNLGNIVGRDADMDALKEHLRALVDAIPAPKNGRDALALEDFDAEVLEDGRTVRFSMTAGDVQHSYELSFPVVIDRGVWREGEYKAGDAVSWAGSLWIAQKDTNAKPDSGDGWRLAVKRGRDGKDAQPQA